MNGSKLKGCGVKFPLLTAYSWGTYRHKIHQQIYPVLSENHQSADLLKLEQEASQEGRNSFLDLNNNN